MTQKYTLWAKCSYLTINYLLKQVVYTVYLLLGFEGLREYVKLLLFICDILLVLFLFLYIKIDVLSSSSCVSLYVLYVYLQRPLQPVLPQG
jgi:hypothetical protein